MTGADVSDVRAVPGADASSVVAGTTGVAGFTVAALTALAGVRFAGVRFAVLAAVAAVAVFARFAVLVAVAAVAILAVFAVDLVSGFGPAFAGFVDAAVAFPVLDGLAAAGVVDAVLVTAGAGLAPATFAPATLATRGRGTATRVAALFFPVRGVGSFAGLAAVFDRLATADPVLANADLDVAFDCVRATVPTPLGQRTMPTDLSVATAHERAKRAKVVRHCCRLSMSPPPGQRLHIGNLSREAVG